ncbi:MAG: hypothetical protein HGA67_00460 [Candidatus Yonathbacteria bacterium]|nr:hypothetical protein [Candidatus Yonathbacteria bacterium]
MHRYHGKYSGAWLPGGAEVPAPKPSHCKIIADICEERGYAVTKPPQWRHGQMWGTYTITTKGKHPSVKIVLCQKPQNCLESGSLNVFFYAGSTCLPEHTHTFIRGNKREPVEEYVEALLKKIEREFP